MIHSNKRNPLHKLTRHLKNC